MLSLTKSDRNRKKDKTLGSSLLEYPVTSILSLFGPPRIKESTPSEYSRSIYKTFKRNPEEYFNNIASLASNSDFLPKGENINDIASNLFNLITQDPTLSQEEKLEALKKIIIYTYNSKLEPELKVLFILSFFTCTENREIIKFLSQDERLLRKVLVIEICGRQKKSILLQSDNISSDNYLYQLVTRSVLYIAFIIADPLIDEDIKSLIFSKHILKTSKLSSKTEMECVELIATSPKIAAILFYNIEKYNISKRLFQEVLTRIFTIIHNATHLIKNEACTQSQEKSLAVTKLQEELGVNAQLQKALETLREIENLWDRIPVEYYDLTINRDICYKDVSDSKKNKAQALEKLYKKLKQLSIKRGSFTDKTLKADYIEEKMLKADSLTKIILKELQGSEPKEYKVLFEKELFKGYSKAAIALVFRIRLLILQQEIPGISEQDLLMKAKDHDEKTWIEKYGSQINKKDIYQKVIADESNHEIDKLCAYCYSKDLLYIPTLPHKKGQPIRPTILDNNNGYLI